MKCVSVVIPTYNEEENIPLVYDRVKKIFDKIKEGYTFQILFIDNHSGDRSREMIRALADKDKRVQYIFNVKNVGFSKSTFYGLLQSQGDCSILLFADMQDPPELILDFIKYWEQGFKVVIGIKNKSNEAKVMYFIRNLYYSFINSITDINHIEQFTGFGLYDASMIDILRQLDDPLPYLRGIVAELMPDHKAVYYTQQKRERGKSSFDFMKLYEVAMLGITSYSKVLMRLAALLGSMIAGISFCIAIGTLLLKVFGIVSYPIGNAAILFGVFFLGGLQLVFLGVLGEYVSNINIRTMKRPLVVEEERGNFSVMTPDVNSGQTHGVDIDNKKNSSEG